MNATVQEEIHRVWDELADFEAGQTAKTVAHLMAFSSPCMAWELSEPIPSNGELPPEWFESPFYDRHYGCIGGLDKGSPGNGREWAQRRRFPSRRRAFPQLSLEPWLLHDDA